MGLRAWLPTDGDYVGVVEAHIAAGAALPATCTGSPAVARVLARHQVPEWDERAVVARCVARSGGARARLSAYVVITLSFRWIEDERAQMEWVSREAALARSITRSRDERAPSHRSPHGPSVPARRPPPRQRRRGRGRRQRDLDRRRGAAWGRGRAVEGRRGRRPPCIPLGRQVADHGGQGRGHGEIHPRGRLDGELGLHRGRCRPLSDLGALRLRVHPLRVLLARRRRGLACDPRADPALLRPDGPRVLVRAGLDQARRG